MKIRLHRRSTRRTKACILAGSIAAMIGYQSVRGANQTWDGGSLLDGIWSTVENWFGDVVPGAASGTTNTDVATFDAPIANTWGNAAGNAVGIDANRNIGGISFGGNAGNYFIGTTAGNALKVSSGGTTQVLSTLTATNAVFTINAPLQIQGAGGSYTLANNSANGSGAGAGTLKVRGAITGAVAGTTTLTLSGTNTNANEISGSISNGTATNLGLTKLGAGTWILSGANSYTGPTTIGTSGGPFAGTLQLSGAGTISNAALSIFWGTLDLNGTTQTITTLNFASGANGTAGTVAIGTGQLNLTGDVGWGTAGGGLGGTISGTTGLLTLNGNRTFGISDVTATADLAISAIIRDNAAPGGPARTLTKTGTGTLLLSGANLYTGGTTISTGAVVARSASALGTGNVTVAANAALNYQAGTDVPLALGGTLSITGGTSTTIGGSLGSTTTSAQIDVAGAATVTGAVKVTVSTISGIAPTAATYTLLHGGAGSNLSGGGASYSLGTIYNNTNFTLGTPTATLTDLTVSVLLVTPLPTAYWKGGLTGATTVWAASNGSTQSNWTTDPAGTVPTGLVPGAGTALVFSSSSITTAPSSGTLGADMTIGSLTQQDTANQVILAGDGSTLTIAPANPASGITLTSTALSLFLSAPIALGAPQTWTNNTSISATLNVLGNVTNGANLLTVGGAGNSILSGVLGGGAGGLTKTGTGTLSLGAANTYTGATTILAGTVQFTSSTPGAITASSGIAIGNNATLTLINNTADSTLNRLGDGIGITSHGGGLIMTNTVGSGVVYAETVGAVTLAGGHLTIGHGNDQTGGAGNIQTLTLTSLTPTGSATVGFFAQTTGLNNFRNFIKVTGATATPAGQIIGPWATVGTGGSALTDYAVYDAAGRVLPSGSTASASVYWANAANAYTTNVGETFFVTRNVAAVRAATGFAPTLTLALGSNLGTTGLLNVGTIGVGTGGVLTLPTTTAASLYVMASTFNMTITAPIRDNTATGVLTLVKSGGGSLTLSGANTFTGGVALNGGTLLVNTMMALGTGPLTIAGGTALDQNAFTNLVLPTNNPVTINGDFTFTGTQSLNLGTGAVTLGTAPGTVRTITANGTGKVLTLGGAIANGTTANSLTHAGSGTLVLAGSNTFTGAVAVTSTGVLHLTGANAYAGGTTLSGTSALFARNATALGSGAVTVGTNTALNYQAGADAPLAIGGPLLLTGGASTILGGSIGSTATSAQINVTALATATGAVKVNVFGNSFSGGADTYTLLHSTIGSSTVSGANYTLGTVYNNTTFTVGALTATTTDLTITTTAVGPLPSVFWKGGLAGAPQVWAASNGTNASNWATDLVGTATPLVPGAGADLTFLVNSPVTVPTASTLGADMTIKSLTQNSAPALTLNADGYQLTISPLSATTGITVNSGMGAVTLNPNIVLGAAQTWTNNSSNTLNVTGNVLGGANLLTVAGTGGTTILGTLSGSVGLAKTGTGTLTLGGVNTYTGDTTIGVGGTLTIANTGSLGSGNYAGNITFAGGGTLTWGTSADQTLTGVISGSGARLDKSGTGTLTLSNNQTFTGGLTNSAGRLVLSGNNVAATGNVSISGGIVQFSSAAAIPGTARNVTTFGTGTVLFDATFGAGNIATALLNRITTNSTGTIAADNYAGTNFDFATPGLASSFLGAVGNVTYTGTLTPNGTAWRLGGGGGVLTMAAPLTGTGYTLTVGGYVVLPAGNTFTGVTTINSGATLQLDSGLASLASPSIVNNGNLIVTTAGTESFGPITGGGVFYKQGAGQLTLAAPQYTGRTVLSEGTLIFSSPSYSAGIVVNGGATLTLAGSGDHQLRVNQALELNSGTVNLGAGRQWIGTLSGQTGLFPGTGGSITGTGTLTINQTANLTFAGNLGAGATALNVVKTGPQTLTLSNAQSTTGALAVIGGQLTLIDSGTLLGISSLALNYATLTIDNTGTQHLADRVRDTAPLNLKGGTLFYRGLGSTLSVETFGALTVSEGASVINPIPNNVGTNAVDLIFSGGSVGLAQSGAATVHFVPNTGTFGVAGSGNPRVAFTVGGAPATTGNVIAGGLVNGIIPWATVGGTGSTELASYIAYTGSAGGIGALNASGYANYGVSQNGGTLTGTGLQNVRTTASAVVGSGGLTINALTLNNASLTFAGGVNSTDKLNLTAGALVVSGAGSIGGSVDSGQLTAGGLAPGAAQTLYVFKDFGTLTINSRTVDNPDASTVRLVLGTAASAATFTLTNPANSYSGGTVINRANVTLSGTASTVLATAAVIPYSVNGLTLNNATLTVSTNAQQIAAGNIVTLNGGSVLNLTGTTQLAGLVFNSNGGNNTPSVQSGTTLVLTGGITSVPTNVAVVPQITTNLDFNGQAGALINVAAHADGNLVNTGPTPSALNGLAISSLIQNGGLTKTGTGVLNLTSTTSNYAGQLTVENGVLNVGTVNNVSSNGVLGNSALAVILGKTGGQTGTLEYSGPSSTSTTKPFTLAGGGTGGFQIDGPTFTLTLSAAVTENGSGGGSLAKTGAGTLALSATGNNYTGATTVSAGTLSLTGSLTGGTAITVNGTGVLTQSSTGAISGAASLAHSSTGTSTLAGTNTYTGATQVSAGTLTVGSSLTGATAITVSGSGVLNQTAGVISGAASLTHSSTGTSTLAGANTYSGPTSVTAGTLLITGSSTLSAHSAGNTGTLRLDNATLGGGVSLASGGNLALATGSGSGLPGEYYNVSNQNGANFATLAALNAHLAGQTVALRASSSLAGANFDFGNTGAGFPAPYNNAVTFFEARWVGQYNAATAGSYTFFTASDDGSMLFVDGATVVNNNFGQAITERSGSVTLTAGLHDIVIAYYQGINQYGFNASVTAPGGSKVLLPNSSLSSLKASTIGSLTGVAGSTVTLGGNTVLRTGTDNTSTAFAGVISGGATDTFAKIGTGTQTLSGVNTFTGATTVTGGGALLVSGSLSGSTASVTGTGSTLGGTGTVGNVSVGSGAILQGGDGATASGALTSGGNVSLDDNSVIKLTLGLGLTHSTLARTGGTWTFDNDQKFTFSIIPGATAGLYDNVITGVTAGQAATVGTWTIDVATGVTGTFIYDGANVDLNVSVIPEPGTAALLLAGLPLLGLRRRRR